MSNFGLLHVCSRNYILEANWSDMMRHFPLMAEENLRSRLQTRLGQNIQVRTVTKQIVPDDLIIWWTGQTMSDLCQVCELLGEIT